MLNFSLISFFPDISKIFLIWSVRAFSPKFVNKFGYSTISFSKNFENQLILLSNSSGMIFNIV